MANAKKGLGKGLSALMAEKEKEVSGALDTAQTAASVGTAGSGEMEVDIEKLQSQSQHG